VFRAVGNILGFVLAGAGGFSLFDVEQGWVFATLALASVIMLSSGIFASWLLVLQIGVASAEKSSARPTSPRGDSGAEKPVTLPVTAQQGQP